MNRQAQGFTLIELMVTIAVIAIIATIAIPAFNQMTERRRLDTTARDIALLFGEVRSQAIALRKEITIQKCREVSGEEVCDPNTATIYYQPTQIGNLELTSAYIDTSDIIVRFSTTGQARLDKTELVDNPNFDNTRPDSLTLSPPTQDNPSKIERTIDLAFTLCDANLGESRTINVSKVGVVNSITTGTCS